MDGSTHSLEKEEVQFHPWLLLGTGSIFPGSYLKGKCHVQGPSVHYEDWGRATHVHFSYRVCLHIGVFDPPIPAATLRLFTISSLKIYPLFFILS